MGAGSTATARPCAHQAEGNPRLGHFTALLAEHEAEAEYQGWLAEVEAEWEAARQEEAAAYRVAQLSTAIYAPTGEPIPGVQLGTLRSTMRGFLDRIGTAIRAEDQRQASGEEVRA